MSRHATAEIAPVALTGAPTSQRIRSLLIAFAVLLVLGMAAMTAALVTRIFSRVNPSLLEDLRWNARRGAVELAQGAEVGMVVRDDKLLLDAMGDYRRRADVQAIVVRDEDGAVLAQHGRPPTDVERLFGGPPDQVQAGPGYLVSWHAASIEGSPIGSLALVLSTARLTEGEELQRSILGLAALGSLAALVLSLLFVRFNIAPLIDLTGRTLAQLQDANDTLELRSAALGDANTRLQESVDLLHTTQEKLVHASRLSGMADVATTVLHNVGNVLNSVNVSANMVIDRVRGSRLSGLDKINRLLGQHTTDLGEFLSSDPRGQQVPAYLQQLALAVDEEHAMIEGELRSLQKNIDHIKVIIGMQQRHARSTGVALERLQLGELLDDALKLAAASNDQGVRVEREYRPLPEVITDRHKLLQIVMNLLSNARHAVRESPPERRLIRVRLGPAPDGRCRIEVEDSGYGIAAQNLARIFNHGFTTKRDGHGFGLHSSANAAREMGGSLTVHSDGEGRGARFVVTLPIAPSGVASEGPDAPPRTGTGGHRLVR